MTIRIVALFALLSLGSIPRLVAQDNQTLPTRYAGVIGPDDGVAIVASDADEISKTWRVSSTGDLNLPMVGKIHAAGLTVEQLEHELTLRLNRFIHDPQVTVYVSEFRSQPVTVAGAVERPGTIQTEGPKTLLSVLVMAGGPKSSGPTVTVTREMKYGSVPLPEAKTDPQGQYSTVELKLKDVLDASTPAANLIMRPDDVVSVSTQQRLIYVIGEVNRPGTIELVTQDSASIMQVLAAAGGLTKIAAPHNTEIMHLNDKGLYEKVASVDLKRVMKGKGEDKMLTAGDIIVVPSSNLKMYFQAVTLSAATSGIYGVILTRF